MMIMIFGSQDINVYFKKRTNDLKVRHRRRRIPYPEPEDWIKYTNDDGQFFRLTVNYFD